MVILARASFKNGMSTQTRPSGEVTETLKLRTK